MFWQQGCGDKVRKDRFAFRHVDARFEKHCPNLFEFALLDFLQVSALSSGCMLGARIHHLRYGPASNTHIYFRIYIYIYISVYVYKYKCVYCCT